MHVYLLLEFFHCILLMLDKDSGMLILLKIDRLYGWQTNPHSDIVNTLNRQKPNTRMEFNDRVQQVIVQFAEQVCFHGCQSFEHLKTCLFVTMCFLVSLLSFNCILPL